MVMSRRLNCNECLVVIVIIFTFLQVPLWSYYVVTKTISSKSGSNTIIGSNIELTKTVNSAKVTETVKIVIAEDNDGHKGFELAAAVTKMCTTQHVPSVGTSKAIHAISDRKLLYCPIPKTGSTFWRRVLTMLVMNDSGKYKQPYDVPIPVAWIKTHILANKQLGILLADNSFSFLFIRNPYKRLLSAFIDKLVPPNPTFWKKLGYQAVKQFRLKNFQPQLTERQKVTGHDVTFPEFVKLAVSLEQSGGENIDGHIISINKLCKPCTYNYTYIGKLESFKNDSLFIMKKLKMKTSIEIMKTSFTELSVDDAITDSIRSPFSWRDNVITYISWHKALQRIWLKLQMRGIIESKIQFDIQGDAINKTTVNEFIEIARKAHRNSDPVELEKQKVMVTKEAFASVPLTDIKAFKDTFKTDFVLFGYELSPSYIFDRTEKATAPTTYFNYHHLN